MCLSEEIPHESWATPHAHAQNIKRANVYDNEMVLTYCDLNHSGASLKSAVHLWSRLRRGVFAEKLVEIPQKSCGNLQKYTLLHQEIVRKFCGMFVEMPRKCSNKCFCNDPFPNDPISELHLLSVRNSFNGTWMLIKSLLLLIVKVILRGGPVGVVEQSKCPQTAKYSLSGPKFPPRFWEGSGKGSGKGFSEGFWEGGLLWVLQQERVLRGGSQKGFLRRGFPEGAWNAPLESTPP